MSLPPSNPDGRKVYPIEGGLVRPVPPQRPAPPQGAVVMSATQAEDLTRRLTMANMALRRGDTPEARRLAEELAQAYPQAAAAHEAVGDALAAAGDHPGAIRAYKQALAVEPGRPTAEMKLGRSAIRTTEMSRRARIGVAYPGMEGVAGAGKNEDDRRRATRMAVICSAIVPGLGQILTGRVLIGGILAAAYLLDSIIVFRHPATQAMMNSAFHARGSVPPSAGSELAWGFFALLLTGIWVFGMIDAARNVGESGSVV